MFSRHLRPSFSALVVCFVLGVNTSTAQCQSIDRHTWVTRHNVHLTAPDIWSPLSVGNGAFCFTADVTGLQTFEGHYLEGIPLGAMADWAWHTTPSTRDCRLENTFVKVPSANGREAPYPINLKAPDAAWLRANPHKFSLGQIGLVMKKADGSAVVLDDLEQMDQRLDLWEGVLTSRFAVEGVPVTVVTCCRPDEDAVAVRVESSLLAEKRLAVRVAFAYPNGDWGKTFNDWKAADRHQTDVVDQREDRVQLRRTVDGTCYGCTIGAAGAAIKRAAPHEFLIEPSGDSPVELTVAFSEDGSSLEAPWDFAASRKASAEAMEDYWRKGGALDLSRSSDPRWRELERRIVLSEYLMGIQSRGRTCPQETGLTCNSWHGKFHLEMHWWHSVHFALWGREDVLARQLQWYLETMPVMRGTAEVQGYRGVRWGKMLGPDGREAPSSIGPLLVWQQPHPIYYAELLYRHSPDQEVLRRYADLVEQTAEFMADFAVWNKERGCFELGPPFISAREFSGATYGENKNGCFELAYWRWGLETANQWRRRLGLEPHSDWTRVAENMAPLPTVDGVYTEQERVIVPDGGHPCQLAAWGLLPKSPVVDEATMLRTMDHVLHHWNHKSTWGWDYPMMAMTAARLGRGDWAIDSLLLDETKNTYRANGHNYQSGRLPCYLPGNGGLLTAAAMMAAGWEGGPDRDAPGFPQDGTWTVRWEGLHRGL